MSRQAYLAKTTSNWHSIFVPIACWLTVLNTGCRSTVPIYVWQPAQFTCPAGSRIAIGQVAGNTDLADLLEYALLTQRPSARADLALITPKQLVEVCPIRLASTASLSNDSTALVAARIAKADYLLQGEVLSSKLNNAAEVQSANYSTAADVGSQQLITSWRLIDVRTARAVANQAVAMNTAVADEAYPDLLASMPRTTDRLVTASARDAWRELAPSVERDQVDLMIPWLQLGAIPTRLGIVDARNGRWDLAEQKWKLATRRNPLNIAARHNLAIAQAAREDFSSAQEMLQTVPWPLSLRLPAESRFWLDQKHRQFQAAHGLGKPPQGWLFPDPIRVNGELQPEPVRPVNIDELPWWTAVPLMKPPGWSWQDWLRQPWVI